MEEGNTILLDRYTTSSIIYQSANIEDLEEKKEFVDFVYDYEYNKLGIGKPDHVIFLHAPFELVEKLQRARKTNDGIPNDIHERNKELMRRIYDNAMFLSEYLGWDNIECSAGEEMLSREEIHEKVYQKVKR